MTETEHIVYTPNPSARREKQGLRAARALREPRTVAAGQGVMSCTSDWLIKGSRTRRIHLNGGRGTPQHGSGHDNYGCGETMLAQPRRVGQPVEADM